MTISAYTVSALNVVGIKTTETSIPYWANQVVTVHGIRDYSDEHGVVAQVAEEYMFTVNDIRKMPAGSGDEILRFVEERLVPENLVTTRPVLFFEGLRHQPAIN